MKSNKKRLIIGMLIFVLPVIALCGCTKSDNAKNDKINIVCTIFPQYDWVRQVLGDKADQVELTLLLDNKTDLHSYEPSVEDVGKISTCDLFIYVGGESDEWVEDALKEAKNKDMVTINLLETLGDSAKVEELLEGMEEEAEEVEGSVEEAAYDEHVWLSLKNAKVFSAAIADALSSLDSANSEVYKNNSNTYISQLSSLDTEYEAAVKAAPVKNLLFGDRFPFRYLMDDYNITDSCYAAFPGCSAETEASADTVVFLANKTKELKLKAIVVTESSDQSLAKTISSTAKTGEQKILVIDSLQSVDANDVKNGAAYLSIMEKNLDILKEAMK